MKKNVLFFLLKPSGLISKISLFLLLIIVFSIESMSSLKYIKSFFYSDFMTITFGNFSFNIYNVVKSILTLVALLWTLGIFTRIGEKKIKSIKNVNASNKAIITKVYQIVTYSLLFTIGMDVIGIDLKALSVFSGAVGLGLGFGLQKIASNFMSGIILLFEKSIEKDDLLQLSDGILGFVRYTKARYTLIETLDGKEIMVPNEDFINKQVINLTYSNNAGKIEITVGISYKSNVNLACELMIKSAKAHPCCLPEPSPSCFVTEFLSNAIKINLYFWVADITKGRYGPKSDIMKSILMQFTINKIEIPLPQQEIRIREDKYNSLIEY